MKGIGRQMGGSKSAMGTRARWRSWHPHVVFIGGCYLLALPMWMISPASAQTAPRWQPFRYQGPLSGTGAAPSAPRPVSRSEAVDITGQVAGQSLGVRRGTEGDSAASRNPFQNTARARNHSRTRPRPRPRPQPTVKKSVNSDPSAVPTDGAPPSAMLTTIEVPPQTPAPAPKKLPVTQAKPQVAPRLEVPELVGRTDRKVGNATFQTALHAPEVLHMAQVAEDNAQREKPQPKKDKKPEECLTVEEKPIGSLTVDTTIRLSDDDKGGRVMPENCAQSVFGSFAEGESIGTGVPHAWPVSNFLWAAPGFYHRPLYFEEPNLERYGHYYRGTLAQSALSAAHFFSVIPLLPYHVTTEPHCDRQYTLGRYLPGDCNPHEWRRRPINRRGLFVQGLATTGFVFLFP